MKKIIPLFLAGFLCLLSATPVWAERIDDEDDDTMPELRSVAVSQKSVSQGGKITISADAWDADSRVELLTVTFMHEKGCAKYTAKLLPNSDESIDEPYSGILNIPNNSPLGRYRLQSVLVKDRNENRKRYTAGTAWDADGWPNPFEQGLSFSVVPQEPVPAPKSCSVTENNGVIQLNIALENTNTEVDKITLLFENMENHHKYVCSLDEDTYGQNNVYSYRFSLSPYEPSGVFTLKQLSVKTAFGETQTWSDAADEDSDNLQLSIAAAFHVQSLGIDSSPPQFLGITAGTPVRDNADEKIRIPLTVYASDDLSGVEHITVKFKNPQSDESISKVLYASDCKGDGLYRAELSVKFEKPPGQYQLDCVTVCDYAGNRITYCTQEDLTDKKELIPATCFVTID